MDKAVKTSLRLGRIWESLDIGRRVRHGRELRDPPLQVEQVLVGLAALQLVEGGADGGVDIDLGGRGLGAVSGHGRLSIESGSRASSAPPNGGGQTARRSGGGKRQRARLLDLTRKPAEGWGGGGASGPCPV